MGRWEFGAAGVASRATSAACLLLAALLLGAPAVQAASSPAATSTDVSERAAQARALLDTPQGAALLDLLGDPAVRERLMAAPTAPAPRRRHDRFRRPNARPRAG